MIFSDESLMKIEKEIEESPYFNFQSYLYEDWDESDTTSFYWTVYNYLKANRLTGYWIKKDKVTYEFIEPNLGWELGNSHIFDEAYDVDATLSLKENKLTFIYFQP